MCVFELVQLLCGIGPLGLIDLHIRRGMSVLHLLVLRLLAIMVSIIISILFPERECNCIKFNTVNTTQSTGVQFAFFFIEWECTEILPGYLGCDFQYTLALEKKNTQPQVGMKWKMRPPQRFALVAVFSKTSLLSAVYYYIINKQWFHPGTLSFFACY